MNVPGGDTDCAMTWVRALPHRLQVGWSCIVGILGKMIVQRVSKFRASATITGKMSMCERLQNRALQEHTCAECAFTDHLWLEM